MTLTTLLVGYFLRYSSGLFDVQATAGFVRTVEAGGRLADSPSLSHVLTGFGVVARLVTTVILMVAAGLATGLAADLLAAQLGPSPERVGALRLTAAPVPGVLWLTHFALLRATGDLGWPFVLWGGVVILAAGAGYALSLLAVAPPIEA